MLIRSLNCVKWYSKVVPLQIEILFAGRGLWHCNCLIVIKVGIIGRHIGIIGICSITLMFGFTSSSKDEGVKKTYFDVTLNDNIVGDLTITEKKVDSVISYTLLSNVKVNYLITVKIVERMNEDFDSGILVKSNHTRHINRVKKASNHLIRKNRIYEIYDSVENEATKINSPIGESTLSVYFKEPIGIYYVYSQNFRKKLRIRKIGDHKYGVALPTGKVSKFTYKQGKLIEMESSSTFGTIKFKRK